MIDYGAKKGQLGLTLGHGWDTDAAPTACIYIMVIHGPYMSRSRMLPKRHLVEIC